MDGTLLDDELNVSRANREAIAAAEQLGVKVVLSTGRNIGSVREYAASLSLSSYFVTANGAEVWEGPNNVLARHRIPTDIIAWLVELAHQHDTRYWGITTDGPRRGPHFPSDLHAEEWLKFGYSSSDLRKLAAIREVLRTSGQLEVTNSAVTNIEVNAKGVSKARALQTVCRELNTTMDRVVAVGDSLNDMAMIREAGCGVAMGNAQQVVKEAADWVTETNTSDGVAAAIERFVLSK